MKHTYLYTSRRPPSLLWPIMLIGVGMIFLLSNMGLLAVDAWTVIWRLWPVLLIVIGLDVVLASRGLWGSIASLGLGLMVVAGVIAFLFVAQGNPTLFAAPVLFGPGAEVLGEHLAQPLNEARSADVRVDFHGSNATVYALDDSANLFEGDVSHSGSLNKSVAQTNGRAQVRLSEALSFSFLTDASRGNWKLGLNPVVDYDLDFDTGSGSYQFDLSQLTLQSLAIHGGSGSMTVALPAGSYRCDLSIGSGSATVRLPEGVPARVEFKTGSGSVSASNLRQVSKDRRTGVYQTENFAPDRPFVTIAVDAGSGSVTLR